MACSRFQDEFLIKTGMNYALIEVGPNLGNSHKHAPIVAKRIRNKPSVPWLTKAIRQKNFERNCLELHALKYNSEHDWKMYRMIQKWGYHCTA